MELSKILFGSEFVANNTVVTSLINANSPMTWDDTMLGALKVYARNNQAVIISPFILAGAMSPVSVAGTLAQTLAEALSGIAFTQAVNPGRQLFLVVLQVRCRCKLVLQLLVRQNRKSSLWLREISPPPWRAIPVWGVINWIENCGCTGRV